MLLDGKKVANDLKELLKQEARKLRKKLRLCIVMVGGNPSSLTFIKRKEQFARDIGCNVRVYKYQADISTTELRKRLADIVHIKSNTGVVLQLPLPPHIKTDYVLNAIIPKKDVDVLSSRSVGDFVYGRSLVVPPVVGAIDKLFSAYNISLVGKHTYVVGAGRLVGRPVAIWLMNKGMQFTVLSSRSGGIVSLKSADVIITGVGKPRLITADVVKEGVIIVDAGTSEDVTDKGEPLGKSVGDVDFPSVSKKASYITPVPGGIGPLTVAMVFQNLLALAKRSK